MGGCVLEEAGASGRGSTAPPVGTCGPGRSPGHRTHEGCARGKEWGTWGQPRVSSWLVWGPRAVRREIGVAGKRLCEAPVGGRGGTLSWLGPCAAGGLPSAPLPAAWQGVERDLRSQVAGSERGLVEEYVEKVPNPSLKSEWAGRWGGRGRGLPVS